jgi:hypothetical protein
MISIRRISSISCSEIYIDETTEVGKRILQELSENPYTAQVGYFHVAYSLNNNKLNNYGNGKY